MQHVHILSAFASSRSAGAHPGPEQGWECVCDEALARALSTPGDISLADRVEMARQLVLDLVELDAENPHYRTAECFFLFLHADLTSRNATSFEPIRGISDVPPEENDLPVAGGWQGVRDRALASAMDLGGTVSLVARIEHACRLILNVGRSGGETQAHRDAAHYLMGLYVEFSRDASPLLTVLRPAANWEALAPT